MTDIQPISIAAAFAGLPSEYDSTALTAELAARRNSVPRKVVVLDDDPTGTQTVHQVNVVTDWHTDILADQLRNADPVFYILTNTRAYPVERAVAITQEAVTNLCRAARATGVPFTVISRSDSTLRGHFPAETDACRAVLRQELGIATAATVLIPAFFAGGRYTLNDVHWVAEGDRLVPAHQTEFARDPAFGFSTAFMPAYVAEKTAGTVPADQVIAIPLDTIRRQGPAGVANLLAAAPAGSVIVVNAVASSDLAVVACAFLALEASGRCYLYRTAASFVPVYSGLSPRPLLTAAELAATEHNAGLIVVGSHVNRTTAQLNHLLSSTAVNGIEVRVPELLDSNQRAAEIARCVSLVEASIRGGRHTALYTSRQVLGRDDRQHYLQIGEAIAAALVEIVRSLSVRPGFLVSKGGITSSVIATDALGVKVARVLGQAWPGVPVWQLGSGARWAGLPYVVFPGNVGDERALTAVLSLLCGR